MKQAILAVGLIGLASCVIAQPLLPVGQVNAVDFQRDGSRGTDTLFTFGYDTTPNLVNVGHDGGVGYFFGTGSTPQGAGVEFAQVFELIDGPANVDGIVYLFAVQVNGSGDPASHVKGRLYSLGGTGITSTGPAPRPNTVLREAQLPISDIVTTNYSGVSFPQIWLNGNFAAGYALDGIVSGDSVNLAVTANGYVEAEDRSWMLFVTPQGSIWATTLGLTTDPNNPGSGFNTDLAVGVVLTPSSVSVGESAWMNGMQIDILGGNPNRDGFIVRYAVRDAADMRLFIIDAMGRTMMDQQLGRRSGENQEVVNTNGWAAGTYFVNMIANGKPITKRVVVE
jgi:hypothetical protein